MSTITSFRRAVKAYRNTTRKPAPFACGLLEHAPVPAEPTAPAMPRRVRWHRIDTTSLEDLEVDQRAAESLAMDRYERGLIPFAVAEELAGGSLVGHNG